MAYIDTHRDRFGVEPILHALEVAPSTYYATKARPPSKRALSDAALKPRILTLWKDNYEVYGVRKVTKALRRQGVTVGRDQVGRLMADLGIAGMVRGKSKRTTKSDPSAVRAPDLVKRHFTATEPDRLWVQDFTYVATWSGTVYVAFIIDAFSRAIVGWRAATTMRTDLVLDTLEMAIWRRGALRKGLVAHSELSRARAQCRPFGRSVSLTRSPNRTCDFHRIRLSTCSCRPLRGRSWCQCRPRRGDGRTPVAVAHDGHRRGVEQPDLVLLRPPSP